MGTANHREIEAAARVNCGLASMNEATSGALEQAAVLP